MEGSGEKRVQEPSLGERWIAMLGPEFEQYLGQETGYVDDATGEPLLTNNFHLLCEEHAGAVFRSLQATDPNDPEYGKKLQAAQNSFLKHFTGQE